MAKISTELKTLSRK